MVVFTKAQSVLRQAFTQAPTDTISMKWDYRGNHIILFYSGVLNNQDIFYLHISTPNEVVYMPFFMLPSFVLPGETIVQAYIPNEIFLILRCVAFDSSPEELLKNVAEHLEKADPDVDFHFLGIADREKARRSATVHVANEEDRIYLKTIRDSGMGKNMPYRIRAIYPDPEPIINCLRKNHKTLVFSDDYKDAHDIYVVLKNGGLSI